MIAAQLDAIIGLFGDRLLAVTVEGTESTARMLKMLPDAKDDGVSVSVVYRGLRVTMVRDGIERIGLELLHGGEDGK